MLRHCLMGRSRRTFCIPMFTTFTMFRCRHREGRTTLDELFIGYRLKSLLSGRPRATKFVELCICLFQLLREAIKLPHKTVFLA
jgi:hypothetical protein